MRKSLRAGIIGCGRIASLFAKDRRRKGIVTHAQAYKKNKATILVAASDIDSNRLKDFGKRWGVRKLYSDYQKMLKDEDLDIVSICTPPALHYKIAKGAILAGVKVIFCEKPMACSLREADDLVELTGKKKVRFAVNHSRRWDRFHQNIARYIQSGKIGKIQVIDGYYTAGIVNTGIHLVDCLRMLTADEVKYVEAISNRAKTQADPTLNARLHFAGGYDCFLHGLDVEDYLIFDIDIYGTGGRIRIIDSGFDAVLWKAKRHKQFSGYHQLQRQNGHPFGVGYRDVLKNTVSNIVNTLYQKESILCDAQDGKAALEVVVAIKESYKKRGKIIKLPQKNRRAAIF